MNIEVNNEINVQITLFPKKNKTDNTKYAINLGFNVYQKGIKQFQPSIYTGITVNIDEWNRGEVTGRSIRANNINERLSSYMNTAKNLINEISLKKVNTCSDVLHEIKANAKKRITGKPPRGQKSAFISKLQEYTYEYIVLRYLADKQLCKARRNGYNRTTELIKEYFNDDVPTIDMITDSDLNGFKKWFLQNKANKQNSQTTIFSQIAAIFKYAMRLKIIAISPLPEKFRGSFIDGNRQVLSEKDCLAIINLQDNTLSNTEKIAKYCILVQMLTGMGYSDMKDLNHENLQFSENENRQYIEKQRNKTRVKFKIFLTENAKYMVDKLRELTGNSDKPFNLPSIDYSLRQYKEIGKKAKINISISTYTLRHTFAVDYMEKDGRIEDLAKILGHTLLKTTQIYGKISNKRLAEKTMQLQIKSKMHQIQSILKIA
jgi:site-specific recombinase XerD